MLLLALMCLVAQVDWASVVNTAAKAVPRLQAQAKDALEPSTCASVVINSKVGFLLTAAHCVSGEDVAVTVDGKHADVVRTNRVLDLAVVRFSPKGHTALSIATKEPVMGDEVAVIGYAFGSRQIGTQIGHVSTALDEDSQTMRVGVDVIAGDSGGACVNAKGELVGITVAVQHYGPMHLGIVVPLQAVKDFLDPYLQREQSTK